MTRDEPEAIYQAHQQCIDAIRETGINYMVICPGRMESVGHRNPDVRDNVRINRPTGMFASYEDAAWLMLEGALTSTYDHQLVSIATPQEYPAGQAEPVSCDPSEICASGR